MMTISERRTLAATKQFVVVGKKCISRGQPNGHKTKYLLEIIPMTHDFKVGDHVEWNSEAGRVRVP